jgi:hypothetical protein
MTGSPAAEFSFHEALQIRSAPFLAPFAGWQADDLR